MEKKKITKEQGKIIIDNGRTKLAGFSTFSEARKFFNQFLLQNYVKTE